MLLTLEPDGIMKLIERYDEEVEEIKKSSLQLSWYMRGSVSYNDVLNMTLKEREYINKLAEKNMETTKTSGLPFF